MDVTVVIVNWNVKPLLRRCLASLARQRGVSFETVVVDNASWDGSPVMVATEFPDVTLVANNRNTGFAAACNEGMVRASGEHILLLNPDAEFRDQDGLAAMTRYMREHPSVGILGPRLRNDDGSVQPSVRRFPTLLSQTLILLKLHHVARRLRPLRRYFADGFDYGADASVDQVMGACFMVRGDVVRKIGPLDPGYFIWFEEVDYCKRALAAGYEVRYAPVTDVTHHGGESFAQVFGPKRQRMFNASLRRYFRVHHGRASAAVLAFLHPASMALAYAAAAFSKRGATEAVRPADGFRAVFRLALLLIALFELLSFAAFLVPQFSPVLLAAVLALAAAFAVARFELAVLVLLAELFIGSQGGYLAAAGLESGVAFSLRLGLFLVVFTAWAARTSVGLLRAERRPEVIGGLSRMARDGVLWPYLALLAVFAYATVRGILGGNGFGNVFFDANGYAFFALFPALYPLFASASLRARTAAVLAAAIVASVGKAVVVLFVFSHRIFHVASPVYIWIRDTRVGEITIMTGDFYRVFFQSHVFSLVTAFFVLLLLAYADGRGRTARFGLFGLLAIEMTGLLMGLSRSFWFGGLAGTVALFVLLRRARASAAIWNRTFICGAAAVAVGAAVIAAVYVFPFPQRGADVSFTSLFGSRAFSVAGEAAANSRWALLPELHEKGLEHPFIGSGFGTEVTYTTSDPRLLADNPTGAYTTFAFEWGYHDLWIKFGLAGLAVYAWFLTAVLRPLWRVAAASKDALRYAGAAPGAQEANKKTALLAVGLLVGNIALLATNVFSPYLNHPLGIGIFMLSASVGAALAREYQSSVAPATEA